MLAPLGAACWVLGRAGALTLLPLASFQNQLILGVMGIDVALNDIKKLTPRYNVRGGCSPSIPAPRLPTALLRHGQLWQSCSSSPWGSDCGGRRVALGDTEQTHSQSVGTAQRTKSKGGERGKSSGFPCPCVPITVLCKRGVGAEFGRLERKTKMSLQS